MEPSDETQRIFEIMECLIEPGWVTLGTINGHGIAALPGVRDLAQANAIVLRLAQGIAHGKTIVWCYLEGTTLHQFVQQVVDVERN